MEVIIDGHEINIEDSKLTEYEALNLIGKGYSNSARNWGQVLNENFIRLANSLKSLFTSLASKADKTDIYTKAETDTAIDDRINFLIGSAPHNLDTLYEIAQRLSEDDTKIAQLLDLLSAKADKSEVSSLSSVPVGSVLPFVGTVAPADYRLCDGSALSRTTYAALYALVGTAYGAGDGSTTFNIPDTRGLFLRGLDNGKGVDSGRVRGTVQSDDLKAHTHTVTRTSGGTGGTAYLAGTNYTTNSGGLSTSSVGGFETRPKNLSINYIIRVS